MGQGAAARTPSPPTAAPPPGPQATAGESHHSPPGAPPVLSGRSPLSPAGSPAATRDPEATRLSSGSRSCSGPSQPELANPDF